MSKSAQRGTVAFFDILGYQQIIDNNDIIPVAEIVSTVLLSLPDVTKSVLITKARDDAARKLVAAVLDNIETRVVSDSIIVCAPQDQAASDANRRFATMVFIAYCSMLLRTAFDKGLPLRGAVDIGEYYLERESFAGRPIIDAYRLANRLTLSGAVLRVHWLSGLSARRTTGRSARMKSSRSSSFRLQYP